MHNQHMDHNAILSNALDRYRGGLDPTLIELTEAAVFPGLIPVAAATARKARCTGILLGRPGPRFIRRGRSIRYRLKDILEWLEDAPAYSSTAEATVAKRQGGC